MLCKGTGRGTSSGKDAHVGEAMMMQGVQHG
jgi:hypothetical protein